MSATRIVEVSVGQKFKNWWNQMTRQDKNVTSSSSTIKIVADARYLPNSNGFTVPVSNSVNHSVSDQPPVSVLNSPELSASRKAIDLSKVHREIYQAPEFEGPLEAEYTFCASKQVDVDDLSENDPDALVLYCYVQTSANDVVFLWMKDGQEILPRKRIEIFSQRTSTQLRINYPQLSDAGSYKCEAANPEGRCETITKVIIEPSTTEMPSESSDAQSPDHPREPIRVNARSPIPAVNDARRSRRRRRRKLNMTDCDSSGFVHTDDITEGANLHQVNEQKSTNKITLSDEDLELEDVKALPECDQPSPQNTIGASSNVLVSRNLTKHKRYSVQDTGSSSELLMKPTCSVDLPEITLRSRTLKIFHQKCKSPIVVTDARGNRLSTRPCSLIGNNSLDRRPTSNYSVRSLPMRQRHSLGSQNSPQRHTVKEIVATFEKLQSEQSLNSLTQTPTTSPQSTSFHGSRTDAQNGYFVRRNSVNVTTTQRSLTGSGGLKSAKYKLNGINSQKTMHDSLIFLYPNDEFTDEEGSCSTNPTIRRSLLTPTSFSSSSQFNESQKLLNEKRSNTNIWEKNTTMGKFIQIQYCLSLDIYEKHSSSLVINHNTRMTILALEQTKDMQPNDAYRKSMISLTTKTITRTTSQPRAQWVQSLVAFFNRQTQPNSDQQPAVEQSKIPPSKTIQIVAKRVNLVDRTEPTSDNKNRNSSDTSTPVKEITIDSIRSNPSSSGCNKDGDQPVTTDEQPMVDMLRTDQLKNSMQSEVTSDEPSKNVTPCSSPATQRSMSKAVQVDALIIWSPPILVAQQTTEVSCPENLNSRSQSPKRDVQKSVKRDSENLRIVNQNCTGEQFGRNSNSASFNLNRTSTKQLGVHEKTLLDKPSHQRMRYHQSQPADYVIQVSSDKAPVKSRPEWINKVAAFFTRSSGSSYNKPSYARRLSAPAFTQTLEITEPINMADNAEISVVKNVVENVVEQVSQQQEDKSLLQNSVALNDTIDMVAEAWNNHPSGSLSYLETQQATGSEICSRWTEKEFVELKANDVTKTYSPLVLSENKKPNEISCEVPITDCLKTEDTSKQNASKHGISCISASPKTESSRSGGSPKYGASQRNSVPTVTKSSPDPHVCSVRPTKTESEQELPIRRRPTFDANLLITSEKQTSKLEKLEQKADENVKNMNHTDLNLSKSNNSLSTSKHLEAASKLTESSELKNQGGTSFRDSLKNLPSILLATEPDEDEDCVIEYPLKIRTLHNVDPQKHYCTVANLGRGHFGNVSTCICRKTGQLYASKKFRIIRLTRHNGEIMEVAVLRAVGKHPQIAQMIAAYEYNRFCTIITELVPGGALFERISEEGTLDECIAAKIIRQLLKGLKHLKNCRVLHCDLKPENLMLCKPRGYALKIIDFGLACFYDKSLPPRKPAGTLTYLAPETQNFDPQSYATDLWSVAVIAYEILSGITPFEVPANGDPERKLSSREISLNITKVTYSLDEDGIADASPEAKDFIKRILVRNPNDRPTVEECLEHTWITMPDVIRPNVSRTLSLYRHSSQRRPGKPAIRTPLRARSLKKSSEDNSMRFSWTKRHD
ncbi:hypothetical protein EG68_02399 [Paragonimus skrjabini miyazakii]|uniref:Uncharacterized protein n=1 Tax=Paragonimus skrjabini miyazakii TaxID=59628 RepID=A0A8S9YZU9_9TREM|nr:hypothetical protein EG68_02399 [Paragonimus skrjabini miyazakii]